jgi:hypothetical protein
MEADPPPGGISAFEMSIKPEFQVDALLRKGTIPGWSPPKAGDSCPACRSAKLDYDSLLNLGCKSCGFILVGSFT